MGALIVGSDFIVNHGERLAMGLNVSRFIIGATIIAFGSSFPEMVVSVMANFNGKPNIAISNIIGSSIFNISLVLAIIVIISKNKLNRGLFFKDTSWVLISILLFLLMSIDGYIGKLDSILLISIIFGYVIYLRKESSGLDIKRITNLEESKKLNLGKSIFLFINGLLLITIGGHFVVESASDIANSFKISEWSIGVILISFATSLPELAISISAVVKGKTDMAIGNIISSNLANITMVLGTTGLVKTIPISLSSHIFDISTMVVATIMLVWIGGSRIYSRAVGITLLVLLMLFLREIAKNIGY
jgi:cation:H+ antiporter